MPARDIYPEAVKNAMIAQWLDNYTRFRFVQLKAKTYLQIQVQNELVFDRTRDSASTHTGLRYLLIEAGQENGRRTYGTLLHLDIINGKIWIQLFGGTEQGIANELVALGVPKECIVLGFKSLQRRQITEFAVS